MLPRYCDRATGTCVMGTRSHVTVIVETRDPCILGILEILGILVSSRSSGFPVSLRSLVSLGSWYPRDPRDPWYPCILEIVGIPGILGILGIFSMFQCRYPAETRRDIQHRLLPARCFFDYRGCGSEREAAFSCLFIPVVSPRIDT